MIFIKVNESDPKEKARIMFKHYRPFDPINGIKKADGTVYNESEASQLEKDLNGILLNYTEYNEPKPNPASEGEVVKEYFNTVTKQYVWDYVEAPVSQEATNKDIKNLMMNLLKDSIQ